MGYRQQRGVRHIRWGGVGAHLHLQEGSRRQRAGDGAGVQGVPATPQEVQRWGSL